MRRYAKDNKRDLPGWVRRRTCSHNIYVDDKLSVFDDAQNRRAQAIKWTNFHKAGRIVDFLKKIHHIYGLGCGMSDKSAPNFKNGKNSVMVLILEHHRVPMVYSPNCQILYTTFFQPEQKNYCCCKKLTGHRNPKPVDLTSQGVFIDTKFTSRCHSFPLVSLKSLLDWVFFNFPEAQPCWDDYGIIFWYNTIR